MGSNYLSCYAIETPCTFHKLTYMSDVPHNFCILVRVNDIFNRGIRRLTMPDYRKCLSSHIITVPSNIRNKDLSHYVTRSFTSRLVHFSSNEKNMFFIFEYIFRSYKIDFQISISKFMEETGGD